MKKKPVNTYTDNCVNCGKKSRPYLYCLECYNERRSSIKLPVKEGRKNATENN
jgi:hypothetical protein